jgi:hypothetical protein
MNNVVSKQFAEAVSIMASLPQEELNKLALLFGYYQPPRDVEKKHEIDNKHVQKTSNQLVACLHSTDKTQPRQDSPSNLSVSTKPSDTKERQIQTSFLEHDVKNFTNDFVKGPGNTVKKRQRRYAPRRSYTEEETFALLSFIEDSKGMNNAKRIAGKKKLAREMKRSHRAIDTMIWKLSKQK